MALEMTRKCDVFGTTREVYQYRVEVIRIMEPEEAAEPEPVVSCDKDLCPRGVRRLKSFIDRATSPPGKVATEAEEQKP